MAEVARFNSILRNNQTNVVLNMDGRDERTINTPADLALLQEVGPVLKFDLCVKQYNHLQFMDLRGIPWRIQTTQPITLNRRSEFPVTHAWTYLTNILSSVALIPRSILYDTVLQISNYAFMSYNPRTLVIHVKANLTIMNVTATVHRPPVHPLLAQRNWVRVDDSMVVDVTEQPEAPPLDLPRQPRRKSVLDLKERYGLMAAETEADEELGDCVVCLEELDAAERSSREVLKMPCSHVFHCNCIFKWLQQSNSCPVCRSVIH